MGLKERFLSKIKKNGCWEWQNAKNKLGYGRFNYNGRNTFAHRVSWTLLRGDIPEGLLVLHKCDNKKCVNPSHLFLGTHKDNAQDALSKGFSFSHARGEKHGKTKLTEKDIIKIRQLHANGKYPRQILKLYKHLVGRQGIEKICYGETWKHVKLS